MQKGIVKGDGCLRFLAHLYYCITAGTSTIVHILSLSLSLSAFYTGCLGYPTLIPFTNLESIFPRRNHDVG